MRTGAVIAVLACALNLCSCTRPSSEESFVGYSARDEAGRYCFDLAMDDESCSYDIDIFLLYEGQRAEGLPQGARAATVLQGPCGSIYEGELDLDRREAFQKGRFTKTYLYAFGRGLKPVEYGDWKLYVILPEEIDNGKDVDGVGIRLKRYGSR